MSTSYLSFDMPPPAAGTAACSPIRDVAPTLRPRNNFVDPLKTVNLTPSASYLSTGSPVTPTSPRLMRTSTPRRSSNSPSAGSPRMPRFVANAEQSMSASFRSTPSNYSGMSGYTFSTYASSQNTSRFGTPIRSIAGTPLHVAVPTSTPPGFRVSSRPSSPAPSARPTRARSPGLSHAAPSSPSFSVTTPRHHSSIPTMSPRSLLRELAASWKNRGSENSQAFGEGGYMTVNPGDILQGRYEAITKLGWGEFSTVWLAFDRKATNLHRTFVAVKIAKCRPDVMRGTKYECYLMAYVRKRVSRSAPVATLVDCFETKGKHGEHLCMTMPLLGSNMLCVIEQFKAKGRRRRSEIEMSMVREITSAILRALAHLANANVLHTDLKPENVLVGAPDAKVAKMVQQFCRNQGVLSDPEQLRELEEGDASSPLAILADFGLGLLLEPRETTDAAAQAVVSRKELTIPKPGVLRNDRGMLIQTREYRAPEVLFGTDFNCRTDVWSLGCMTYELITGDFLMDPKKKVRGEREMDIEHVAMMMQILGPVPPRIAAGNGKHMRRYFDTQGRFLYADKYGAYPRRSIATELETFLEPAEAERAAQFIMSCFTYDPAERCHAGDLLRHSWLRGIPSSTAAAL